jgi:hypothetical protein
VPAALARALRGPRASPDAIFRALGWRRGGDDVVLRACTRWPPEVRGGDARWAIESDGRRVRLGAPGTALRSATVDLRRALEVGGVDEWLVSALLGPDGRARARLGRARGALETLVLRAARRALDEALARFVREGVAPEAALVRARALATTRLAKDERVRLPRACRARARAPGPPRARGRCGR